MPIAHAGVDDDGACASAPPRRTLARDGAQGALRLFTSVVLVAGPPVRTLFHAVHARSLDEVEARLAERSADFPVGEAVTMSGVDPDDPVAKRLIGAGMIASLDSTGDVPSAALARGGELAVWEIRDADAGVSEAWAWSEGGPISDVHGDAAVIRSGPAVIRP